MSVEIVTRGEGERHWFAVDPDSASLPVDRVSLATGAAERSTLSGLPVSGNALAERVATLRKLPKTSEAISRAFHLETERGTAFLLIPVFLAAGAFGYFGWPYEPGLVAIIVITLVAGALVALSRRRPTWRFAALALLIIMIGVLLSKVETIRASTKMLGGEISTRITGRVVSQNVLANGRVRLTIEVLNTERPTLKYAPDRVRVTARKVPESLQAGSVVNGLVKLRPPSGPVRPGSYDFSFESYFDGIGASGYFMIGPDLVDRAGASGVQSIAASVENARNRIAERIRDRIGGPEGEIAAALLVGVRAGIPNDVAEALRRTGIYHIISISGLHMALVAGAIISAIRAGFALFPGFASRHPIRKYAAFSGLIAIAGYLVISGGEVAAQRSFIMLAVMLMAVMVDRAALTMRNLAISAIIVLIVAPHEVVGPSFQMSYAATAALVGAYGIWTQRRAASLASPPEPAKTVAGLAVRRASAIVMGLLVTSLVAGLATAAFGAYHFQRISPLSLPANLAVMPIVSGIVVPSAVLAAITMPFGVEGIFLDIMGKGIGAMIAVATWISERSPIDAVGLISGVSVVLLTVALMIATVATTWLRLVAVPFAVAGCLTLGSARVPDLLISEDALLLAFRTPGDELAISRPRGNAFTTETWMRTLAVDKTRKPNAGGETRDMQSTGFACHETTCTATLSSGGVIVQTGDEEEARRACATASVIVVDDATSRLRCANRRVAIVTKRQLARAGSAAVYLAHTGATATPVVDFAIENADRPWHGHRRFSREARGLPAYKPARKNGDNQITEGRSSSSGATLKDDNGASDGARTRDLRRDRPAL